MIELAPMLDVMDLTKSYQRGGVVTPVLTGVTFLVKKGEFVAIMGSSGSGKSTLLNMLGLLDRPDGGRYLLNGEDYSGADDEARSRVRNRTIGFVFQQFHLLERASALRNVTLPLLYADEDRGDGDVRAERALEKVGLAHRKNHLPGELSGGEQQRVIIARALINDPLLVLADEPTGNLDATSAGQILDILEAIVRDGRTVVLITHDAEVAARANRILLFADGRIVGEKAGQRATAPA